MSCRSSRSSQSDRRLSHCSFRPMNPPITRLGWSWILPASSKYPESPEGITSSPSTEAPSPGSDPHPEFHGEGHAHFQLSPRSSQLVEHGAHGQILHFHDDGSGPIQGRAPENALRRQRSSGPAKNLCGSLSPVETSLGYSARFADMGALGGRCSLRGALWRWLGQ